MKTSCYLLLAGWSCAGLWAQTPGPQAALKAVDVLPLELVGRPMSSLISALGTRIQTKGFERSQLTGTVSRPGLPDAALVVMLEHPGRLRVQEGAGAALLLTVLDGQALKATAAISASQLKLAESMLFDTAEYFLFDHANFGRTRYLGDSYRHPRAPASARFRVFEKFEDLALLQPGLTRNKLFYFDSAGLLAYVRYWLGSGGGASMAEVAFTWQLAGGQSFPASIVRWEGGVKEFSVQFTQASAGPRTDDSAFLP